MQQQTDHLDFKFLFTEVQTGFTFANLASTARPGNEDDKRQRNIQNARKAYQTVLKFRERVTLDDGERVELDSHIAQLKSALEKLGGL